MIHQNWPTDARVVSQRRDEIERRFAAHHRAQWPVGWGVNMSQVVAFIKSDTDAWGLTCWALPFGGPLNGRDADGQYFSAATKLYLDRCAAIPAVYYHGFDPDTGKPASEPQYIGKTTGYEVKPDGVWFRVLLDKANDYAARVGCGRTGISKSPSGSVAHLHRRSGRASRTGR